MTIILSGETPSKKNSRINTKSGKSFPNPRYIAWHEAAVLQTRIQTKGCKAPMPCSVKVTFYHGDNHRRDADNGMSSILDMLKDAGVIEDDCWKYIPHEESWNFYDKGNARCVIEINEIKEW